MVELVLVVALALLVVGVIGSVAPLVPSGLVSLAGIWTYVLFGSEPVGPILITVLTLTALLAAVFEYFGGPIAAKASGSSNQIVIASTVGGLLLLFVMGPIGIIVGIVGTIFLLELKNGADTETATRRSVYTAAGVLASSVVQALLTLSILAAFVLFVVVL